MLPYLASPIIDDRGYGKECCLSLHKSVRSLCVPQPAKIF
jgi:hypothetical protein